MYLVVKDEKDYNQLSWGFYEDMLEAETAYKELKQEADFGREKGYATNKIKIEIIEIEDEVLFNFLLNDESYKIQRYTIKECYITKFGCWAEHEYEYEKDVW